MSLVQFLRILMARRWIILGALLVCLVTTGIVSLFVPKYYEGKSRVELNVVKPDPVKGEAISPTFMRASTRTHIAPIKDARTHGVTPDKPRWAKQPATTEAHQHAPRGPGGRT